MQVSRRACGPIYVLVTVCLVSGAVPSAESAVRPSLLEYPPPLFWSSAAYDSESDRVILFGGTDDAGIVSDQYGTNQTWAFDAENAGWRLMHPAASPPARMGSAMAYDRRLDRVVLFGGVTRAYSGGSGGDLNDTWTYDFNRDSWELVSTTLSPGVRSSHEMVYVDAHGLMIVFGGQDIRGRYSNETWAFDLANRSWQLQNVTVAPRAVDAFGMAYDSQSDRVVMFGGATGVTAPYNETWLYDTANLSWTQATSLQNPAGRYIHRMAYDTSVDRVVLVGGERQISQTPFLRTYYADTWEFDADGGGWSPATPSPAYSGTRLGAAITYSDAASRIVLVAGGSAWLYDRPQNRWSLWRWPDAPFALEALPSLGRIDLRWNPPNGTADRTLSSYRVYRGNATNALLPLANVSGRANYTDEDLVNGTVYWYAVAALGDVGEGPNSDPANATAFVAIPPPGVFVPPTPLPWLQAVLFAIVAFGLLASTSTQRGREALATLLLAPLFTRLRREEVRSQYSRGRLIQHIKENPGTTFTQTRRSLGLSNGACAYHLQVLERSGEIRRVAHGPMVRFFTPEYKPDADELPPLSHVQRRILEEAVGLENATFGALSKALAGRGDMVTEKNLGYHLKVLTRDKALLRTSREGGRTVYFVDPGERDSLRRRLEDETAADDQIGIVAAATLAAEKGRAWSAGSGSASDVVPHVDGESVAAADRDAEPRA